MVIATSFHSSISEHKIITTHHKNTPQLSVHNTQSEVAGDSRREQLPVLLLDVVSVDELPETLEHRLR